MAEGVKAAIRCIQIVQSSSWHRDQPIFSHRAYLDVLGRCVRANPLTPPSLHLYRFETKTDRTMRLSVEYCGL